jgi:glucokinase
MQVSGTGLVNVYEFLSEKFPERVDPELHAQIVAAGDMKGKFIAQGASVKVRFIFLHWRCIIHNTASDCSSVCVSV